MKTKHLPWVFLTLGSLAGCLATLVGLRVINPPDKIYHDGDTVLVEGDGGIVWHGSANMPGPGPSISIRQPRLINPPYEHNGTAGPPAPFWSYQTSPVSPAEPAEPSVRIWSLPPHAKRFQLHDDPRGVIWHYDPTVGDEGAWLPEPASLQPRTFSGVHSEPIPLAKVPLGEEPKLIPPPYTFGR